MLLPHFPCGHPAQPSIPPLWFIDTGQEFFLSRGLWRSSEAMCSGTWILNVNFWIMLKIVTVRLITREIGWRIKSINTSNIVLPDHLTFFFFNLNNKNDSISPLHFFYSWWFFLKVRFTHMMKFTLFSVQFWVSTDSYHSQDTEYFRTFEVINLHMALLLVANIY